MDMWQHAVISGAGSAALALSGAGLPAAAAFTAAGVFVDLDHLPDYWRDTGFNVRLKPFFAHFDRRAPERLWIFLHGWEWPVLALALAGPGLAWPGWLLGGAAGWLVHLGLDQVFNRFQPLGYFFTYRASQRFESRRFIKP